MYIKKHLYIAFIFLTIPYMVMAGEDDQRPNEHICPITKLVMDNPVVAQDGHSYEKEALEQWISCCVAQGKQVTSPKTNLPMASTFFPNLALRNAIKEWPPTFSQDLFIASIRRMYQQNEDLIAQNQFLKERNACLEKTVVEFQEQFHRILQDKDHQIKALQEQLEKLGVYESVSSGANTPQTNLVTLPKQVSTVYPDVAKGFEEVYDRFMKAKLIYTHPKTQKTKEWVFGSIFPQLFQEGVYSVPFDLSGCDKDTRKWGSINIGFRTKQGEDRWEVWFVPRFLLAAYVNGAGKHYKHILDKWPNSIHAGILWTYGGWDANVGDCGYDVTHSYEELSNKENLYKKYDKSPGASSVVVIDRLDYGALIMMLAFRFSFLN